MRSSRAKNKKTPWSFDDLIDFEYAIRLESTDSAAQIEQRDKAVAERIEREKGGFERNRDLLKAWLDSVREALFPQTWNPGTVSSGVIELASKIGFALSLFTGASMAVGLLSYEGSEPVNVSAYIGIFIILQLVLVTVSLLLVLSLRWAGEAFDCFLGIRLLRSIFLHFASSLIRYAASRLASEHRSTLEETSGDLKSIWSIYRSLLQWKAFARFQVWAIAFNTGVLGATLVIVFFSDRAFGWQTTLQVDAEWLYQVVRTTSLPWSWFAGEGVGFPSVEEIEGSRIILKDGIRSLNSGNLVAWWPYLCLGTTFYGLIPRLVFYVWGRLASRNCLRRLSFSHVEATRIANRIRSSRLGFESNVNRVLGQSTEFATPDEETKESPAPGQGAICLVASDYHGDLPQAELKTELSQRLGTQTGQLDLLPISVADQMEPESLSLDLNARNSEKLYIVFASWMPPIEEIKQLILAVRRNVGPRRSLSITLIGPRDTENGFRAPKPQEISMWAAFIRKLGDPYCSLNPSSK